jgi:hypothetical protein
LIGSLSNAPHVLASTISTQSAVEQPPLSPSETTESSTVTYFRRQISTWSQTNQGPTGTQAYSQDVAPAADTPSIGTAVSTTDAGSLNAPIPILRQTKTAEGQATASLTYTIICTPLYNSAYVFAPDYACRMAELERKQIEKLAADCVASLGPNAVLGYGDSVQHMLESNWSGFLFYSLTAVEVTVTWSAPDNTTWAMILPNSPDGLGPEWTLDNTHKYPHGQRFRHPSGRYLDWHPGRPGMPGNRGKDHWHDTDGEEHLYPGQEVPDPAPGPGTTPLAPSNNPDPQPKERTGVDPTTQILVGAGALVGGIGGYCIYRGIRILPSFLPPLWPTIPANLAFP